MPKTTSSSSGRLSGRFWRLLGASTEKNQGRSLSQVTASADYDEKAAGLDDEQLRKAAGLLDLDDLAEADDVPQFLAIAREAAERATGLRPFDVQLLGALRMLAGDDAGRDALRWGHAPSPLTRLEVPPPACGGAPVKSGRTCVTPDWTGVDRRRQDR